MGHLILVDTNVLSELAKPDPEPRVLAWAGTVAPGVLFTFAICEAEMRAGVALLPAGRRRGAPSTALDRVFDGLLAGRVLPFDRASAAGFARVRAARKAMGRPITLPDALIAATAPGHGIGTVATRNVPDFEDTGVAIRDPWSSPP